MNMQAEKLFVIGSRNLFITRVKSGNFDIELGTSIKDALHFEEQEAITTLNKINEVNPRYISSLRISYIGSKLKSAEVLKFNSSIRSAVNFASNHLEELPDLSLLQKKWNSVDPKLWLADKGLHGIVIHLTRININGENFPSFWEDICHKEAVCFFAVLRGISLNLITKKQILEAMSDKTKRINLNKLVPAVMNRVDSFATEFRELSRKRNDRFVYSDGSNCETEGCSSPAIDKKCWFHFLSQKEETSA